MSVEFDDIPIPAIKSNVGNFNVPEYVGEQPMENTNVSKMTLDEKLASKTIKVKLEGL